MDNKSKDIFNAEKTLTVKQQSFYLQQIKCKKYWPDENKTERFGNIYVKFDYQETFADFILTNLIVTKVCV